MVKDQLGSPKLIINVSDASDVLMSAEYDEFGNVVGTGLGEVSFGFAGSLYDVDTGFVRFGVWDYDPQVGRWTGKDPLLWAGQQFNLYQYACRLMTNSIDSAVAALATPPSEKLIAPFVQYLDLHY